MPSDLICDHSLTRTNTKKRDKTTLEMILENLSSRQNFEHSAVLRMVRAACLHACADARLHAHIILWACVADATTHDAWVVGNCGGESDVRARECVGSNAIDACMDTTYAHEQIKPLLGHLGPRIRLQLASVDTTPHTFCAHDIAPCTSGIQWVSG